MKVWIVTSQEQESTTSWVDSVFSTEEKALDYLSQFKPGGFYASSGKTAWWTQEVKHKNYTENYSYELEECEVQ